MRTITLTNRPPVRINDDNWPKIASAKRHFYDGQYEFQSDRHTRYWLTVRQHEDGRTIIYAVYDHTTAWQSERDQACRRGELLDSRENTTQNIVETIRAVAESMPLGDPDEWQLMSDECIADLPAEVLD
jgi:hypothetical protein